MAEAEFDGGQEEIGASKRWSKNNLEQHADHKKQVNLDGSNRRREGIGSKYASIKANESRRVSDGKGCIENEGESLRQQTKTDRKYSGMESLSPERGTDICMEKLP